MIVRAFIFFLLCGMTMLLCQFSPQPKGGARKDSFCARMSGMPGPMKDEKGQPTRKAASLKRWKC